jgi:thiamine pyrophosphokinase
MSSKIKIPGTAPQSQHQQIFDAFLPSSADELCLIGPMASASAVETLLQGPTGKLPFLAIDGGCQPLLESSFKARPFLHVGDGDSSFQSPEISLSPQKDYSDLAYALTLINSKNWRHLHLLGFFGGRFDHQLAVIGELIAMMANYQSGQSSCREISFYDYPLYMAQDGVIEFQHHGPFSILSTSSPLVSIIGYVEYPIAKARPLTTLSSLGLSNQASGKVQITTQGPLILIFPQLKKLPDLALKNIEAIGGTND